jgi:hypothetical protein
MTTKTLLGLLLALSSGPAFAQSRPVAVPPSAAERIHVGRDIVIRLMVLNEVSTRTARPGDRFVLRVDEPVVVEGVTLIPVGAKGWGEVLSAEKSGHIGKAGTLSARLVSVEVAGQQVPITGDARSAGDKGTGQMALGAFGLGPLALLTRGNDAKLKAGEVLSGYFEADMVFDRTTLRLSPLSN